MDYINDALVAAKHGIREWAKEEIFKRREQVAMVAAIVDHTPLAEIETDDVSEWPMPEKGRAALAAIQQQIRDIRKAQKVALEMVEKLQK